MAMEGLMNVITGASRANVEQDGMSFTIADVESISPLTIKIGSNSISDNIAVSDMFKLTKIKIKVGEEEGETSIDTRLRRGDKVVVLIHNNSFAIVGRV